jgi:CheY-like chemotaxis protein
MRTLGFFPYVVSVALVVIADDDAMVRMTLRIALQRRGHEVVEAVDGDDLLELTASRRFDLCIMDISMPGADLEARLTKLDEVDGPAVLVLSGSASPPVSLSSRVVHRRKPIQLADLDGALDELSITAGEGAR